MDKYDAQIAELVKLDGEKFRRRIRREWAHSKGLFGYAVTNPYRLWADDTGCLTMIRNGDWRAETEELTEAIRADERLPKTQQDITKEHLPVFAEWQRRLDKELSREV